MRTYKLRVVPWHAAGVNRLLEMTGKQTLGDLHDAIQDVFDLDDDHMFAFFMRNKLWAEEFAFGGRGTDFRDAYGAKLDALELRKKKRFLYLFDFGSELTFDVRVEDFGEEAKGVSYPRVLESVGEAPPQYPEEDEDDEEDEDGEFDEAHHHAHCHDNVEIDAATRKLLDRVKPFVIARDSLISKRLDALELLEAANADLDDEDAFEDEDDEEEKDLEEALEEMDDEDLHLSAEGLLEEASLVEAVIKRGSGNQDVLHYLVAHAIEGDVIGWMLGLPRRLHLSGHSGRAAEVCRALLGVLPTDTLNFRLPVFLAAAGKRDEALAAIAHNLEEYPEESGMLDGVGQAYLKLGDDVLAERYLRDALAAAGADRQERDGIVTALAGILDRLGRGADLAELERSEARYRESLKRIRSGEAGEPYQRGETKVGRNDPCPCGSGKKYKKCCGAN